MEAAATTTVSSGITVIGAIGRLRPAEEDGLNGLLAKYGGSFEGRPWYRISWAPDDNKGLRKAHTPSCPKSDPRDWACECPTHILDHAKFPICFDTHQLSYHLLGLRIPGTVDEETARVLGDAGAPLYECTGLHFVDETGAPINPTGSIIEAIIPALQFFSESVRAAAYGADARLRLMRAQRVDAAQRKEAASAAAYDTYADDLLSGGLPAFGGNPMVATTGPSSVSEARLHESDAHRVHKLRET